MEINKTKTWKKAINVFFAFVLMFSCVPIRAFAQDGTGSSGISEEQNIVTGEQKTQQQNENEATLQALSSSNYVFIQSTKDANSSYSYVSGSIKAGTELWANVYEADNSGSYYSTYNSVANDGTFSYQWMKASTKSTTTSDYTDIEGATSQNLNITESLATSLAGSYIAVKITSGDTTLYGPNSTYGSGINSYRIPGPVMLAGQAELYKVTMDNTSPSVGDTITATAYTDSSTQVGSDINVTWEWSYSDSSNGTYTTIESATTNTLTITEDLQGKYIQVSGNAGVGAKTTKTSDAVMAKGLKKLSGVELTAPSKTIGATLSAKAYTGSSYSPTYVDEGVTYTWKYTTSSPSYSTTWTTIEGQTSSTFTVTSEYENCYISVDAYAGVNTVSLSYYSVPGPFLAEGAVTIYAVSIINPATEASVFAVGDTAKARAKEQGASDFIDSSNLNYQWKQGDTNRGPWTNIEGKTSETITLDSSLEGKYINCEVSSKVGSSSKESSRGSLVAAAGSVNVTSVTLDKTGELTVGDELTATANAASGDVTENENVSWSWYYGDSSSSATTQIANANTNKLTVTSDMLGKYIKVVANGGYGDVYKTAGPVKIAGGVDLYNVEVSGSAKVGNTLAATAYKTNSYTTVSDSDIVAYQWQYSDTKTTSDSAFKDIEGATQKTYEVTEAMLGKYIRVKATSNASVVSTIKKSSYSTSSVDPLGPVTQAGAYELSSVAVSSSGQSMQAGSTITPQAKVQQSAYYESNVPEDAKLTYKWLVSDSSTGEFVELDSTKYTYNTADGKLVLDESLVGKYLQVSANAITNTVNSSALKVLGANEYDLLRVNTSPSTGDLITGDTISATVYAKRMDATSLYGDDVSDREGVTYQWYVGNSADVDDSSFTAIADATSKELVVPATAGGKYLKVVATSAANSVSASFPNQVIDGSTLDGLVSKLNKDSFRLAPEYGKDTNVNDMLLAKINSYGSYKDVSVKVTSANNPCDRTEGVSGKVSATDDTTNGDIEYFFIDPAKASYSLETQRQLEVTFEITMGTQTVTYKPSRATSLAWDEAKATEALEAAANTLAIGYATGDTAFSVTQDVTLPNKGTDATWANVAWKSSSEDSVRISGYSWDANSTGKVSRAATDKIVYLTATLSMSRSGGFSTTYEKEFEITVKGDPEKVSEDIAKLQAQIDATFIYDNIKYFETEDVSDYTGLTNDQQLPRPTVLGIDGGEYSIKYTATDGTDSTNQPIVTNGYRTYVYQDLPGGQSKRSSITLTVTNKQNAAVTASKTLEFTVAPMNQADLDKTVALMEAAKAGYAQAILDGQNINSVTQNMHAFQKAYYDAEGNLAWTYNYEDTNKAGWGIVPVELPGYDSMSWMDWRLFKSSKSTVIQSENLVVTQPQYNTKVTINSSLSSDKYARYAERYPDNTTFAKLKEQPVSATVTVLGTTGQDDPNAGKTFTVTARVTGISELDANNNYTIESWIPTTEVTLPADEDTNAWNVFTSLLDKANYTYSFTDGEYSGIPASITSPQGRKLGMTSDGTNWSYWSFVINGEYASTYPTLQTVSEGDVIELVYISGQGTLKKKSISDAVVEMDKKAKYTGEEIEPNIVVTLDGTELIKDRDYTVAYKDRDGNILEGAPVEHGVYTVVLKGIEDYEGTVPAGTFTITKTTDSFKRLGGTDRNGTMSKIVEEAFNAGSCTEAIVASNSSFADALAASSLAGVLDCPIILTDPSTLSEDAATQIKRVASKDGLIVSVVGGSAAVSDDVFKQIEDLDCVTTVDRIFGATRIETADAIYEAGAGNWSDTAIVTKGEDFADALSISSYAYASKSPIFLGVKGELADSSAKAIEDGGFKNIVIVGGDGGDTGIKDSAISPLGKTSTRLSGKTRLETSVEIANWVMGNSSDYAVQPSVVLSCDGLGIASAYDFPDALSSASFLGKNRSVLLLASDSETGLKNVKSMVSQNKDLLSKGYIFGGDAAVNETIAKAANDALKEE